MNSYNPTIYLSDHFTLQEAQVSEIAKRMAIDNSVPGHIVPNCKNTAAGMERVRAALGNKPISVNSWYRSLLLNRVLNSKDNSQHRTGQAVDFICPAYGSPVTIVKCLVSMSELIRYDQIILEYSWVHISFAISPIKPRLQVLSLLSNGSYSTGITDRNGVLL
jgi:hypothetical protein